MHAWAIAGELAHRMDQARSLEEIRALLTLACTQMGLSFFALTHHADPTSHTGFVSRIHNYPDDFASWFDANRLGICDPIHRASHCTIGAFRWEDGLNMIAATAQDWHVITHSRMAGLGDGVTVPANIPGETHGSCSFAVRPDQPLPAGIVGFADLLGISAFRAMRRLASTVRAKPVHLTDRQRDCVYWAIQGKTDGEIATILSIKRDTVIEHLRHARRALGVCNRSQLAGAALRHRIFCLDDLPAGLP